MKLQFSLATLLVCVTVLAVVSVICVAAPVIEPAHKSMRWQFAMAADLLYHADRIVDESPRRSRPPTEIEIVVRMAWSGPLAIAATLAARWAIRRLISRRENEPPVEIIA